MNKKEIETIKWRLSELQKLKHESNDGRLALKLSEIDITRLDSLPRALSDDFEELGAYLIYADGEENRRTACNLMLQIFKELKAKKK